MLQLVIGRSGSGKTETLRRQMAEDLAAGKDVVFLVPEQFSFESECNLASQLAGPDFFRLQVLSFTRLATRIFEAAGKSPRFLDAGGKALLAARAAMTVQDLLQVYQKAATAPGFAEQLLAFFDEASACAVTPLQLEEAAAKLPKGMGMRLSDLAALYASYEQLIEEGVMDPADCLIRASEAAEAENFFAGSVFYLDGFDRFSKAQGQLLSVMLCQAEKVVVALTSDGLRDKSGGFGLFSENHKTLQDLLSLARGCGADVAAPIFLQKNLRAKNDALLALEEGFLSEEKPEKVSCEKRVRILACDNVYQEVETVCALILEAVRKEAVRFRDVVVITRSLEENADLFAHTFAKYQIPLFLDQRESVANKPLAVFLRALLDVLRYGFQTEDLLRYVKTGATGLDDETISQLENYAYIWQIDRGRWKKPFLSPPSGMKGEMSDRDRMELDHLESVRKGLIGPLLRLHEDLKQADGKTFAAKIWEFLEKEEVQRHLEERYTAEMGNGPDLLEESRRVYACLAAVFDQFVAHFGGESMDLPTFIRLYDLQIAQYTLGEVPNTLDSVLLGTADRIRTDNRKICFVSGFTHGSWPLEGENRSLVTPKDRRALLECEIDLGGLEESMAIREDLVAYTALTAASEKVIITYAGTDRNYAPLQPSRYLQNVKEIFSDLEEEKAASLDPVLFVCNKETLRTQASAHFGRGTKEEATLFGALKRIDPAAAEALEEASLPKIWKLEDQEAAKTLYGSPVKLSASRVDRFYGCKFSYFLEYALSLKERRKAEIAPLEAGNLIHSVLEDAVREFGGDGLVALSETEIKAFCKEKVYAFAKENFCDIESLSARQKAKLTRISSTLALMIRRLALEFEQSEFVPVDPELPMGDEREGLPAFTLCTPSGNEISVVGKIDRVDVMEKKGVKYIRVVDYKSGTKDFALRDVYYGLNLQMLLYLFSIWRDGEMRYGNRIPAGILYFPARPEWKEGSETLSDEQVIRQFPMQGIVLQDEAVLSGMDPTGKGLFIPAACKKNGGYSKEETLATLQELGAIRAHVEKALCEMADQLMQGRIEALPRVTKKSCRCDYSAYQAICQNEMAEKTLTMSEPDKEAFYRLLQAEESHQKPMMNGEEVSSPWQ